MPKKGLFLDETNPYQKECLDLLDACGHKQGRLLGLIVHDFLMRTRLDVNKMDKKSMLEFMNFMEGNFKYGNPWASQMPVAPMMQQAVMPVQQAEEVVMEEMADDDFFDGMITDEGRRDMEEALSMFAIA